MPRHATRTSFRKGHPSHRKGVFILNDAEELRKLYWDEKMTPSEIAELKGINGITVRNALIRMNIPLRTRSEARINSLARGRSLIRTTKSAFMCKENNPRWNGGRHMKKGYVMIYKPDHPRANPRYVPEHILVWEETHGTPVPKGHIIHHINGIRDDNRPVNLVSVPVPQHETNTRLKIAQKRIRELELKVKELDLNEVTKNS